jgi:glycosyltransferase involved in cell wall biosynthesis
MSKKPYILYVLGGALDHGGTEFHLYHLLPRLNQIGYEIEVHCLRGEGVLAEGMRRMGVRVTSGPMVIGKMRGPMGKLARLVSGGLFLSIRIIRKRPDVIHFFLRSAYVLGGYVARFWRIRYQIMSRRDMNLYMLENVRLRRQEAFFHRRMDVLLGNSKAVTKELIEEGADSEKVGLIYNGIDVKRFEKLPKKIYVREQLGLPLDALVLVNVANLWAYKGHSDLIKALVKVSFDREWRLLLVGRDEGAECKLNKLLHEYDLVGNVIFAGDVDDVRPYLAAADVAVSASHKEGFSNAVLEYLAAGLPSVLTDVGGNREAIGGSGLIVPAHDSDAFASGLNRLLREPSLEHRAALARQRAKIFSLEASVQNYDAVYQSVVSGLGLPAAVSVVG